MEQYFKDVIQSLSIDDMKVLGALQDQDATQSFKAISNNQIQSISGLSDSTYRKVIYRLIAIKFIQVVMLRRQHSLFITPYGIEALRINLEGIA